MAKAAILLVATLLGLVSLSHAIEGTATFYTTYTSSACYGSQEQGMMIAAASDELWEGGAACGRMYSVRCTGPTNPGVPQPCNGNTITVKIVDHCPGCGGTLDLSQEDFAAMAVDLKAGKILTDYSQV